eukprot:1157842-Pelagomonas_calceolata.AAC.6
MAACRQQQGRFVGSTFRIMASNCSLMHAARLGLQSLFFYAKRLIARGPQASWLAGGMGATDIKSRFRKWEY